MIFAVDFDGTLCVDRYPEIGAPNTVLIEKLKSRQSMGNRLILWTCRANEMLDEAVSWCRYHGLCFDAVNANVQETIDRWGNDSRKISADIYIDDRAEKPWETMMDEAV